MEILQWKQMIISLQMNHCPKQSKDEIEIQRIKVKLDTDIPVHILFPGYLSYCVILFISSSQSRKIVTTLNYFAYVKINIIESSARSDLSRVIS